jgi:hypothetical protein
MRFVLASWLVVLGVCLGAGRASAQVDPAHHDDPAHHEGSADPAHHEGSADPAAHEGSADPAHHEGSADPAAHEGSAAEGSAAHEGSAAEGSAAHEGSADGSAHHDDHPPLPGEQPAAPPASDEGSDETDEVPYNKFDEDGDGKVEPEEAALQKEYGAAFEGIDANIDDQDIAALAARPADKTLLPSLTVDHFRQIVRITKKVVLERIAKKITKKNAKRMATFGMIVVGFSLCGVLLLLMPLVLAKRYPGQGGVLFKYSALAALTFIVTVNLFGGVLFGLRTVQGELSKYTDPQVALAAGFFDTLDNHAEDYVVMGKELFAPTLEQLSGRSDEQPTVALLGNGMRIVKDAKVFLDVAKTFKKVSFIFGVIPIILMIVTLVLFVLAIRPTLTEIVKLPAMAASGAGGVGKDVVAKSMRRVVGELKATLCTIGVLAVLTLLSSVVLGRIVGPALQALLEYFSLAVQYLQFVHGASSGMVFLTLFGVILFLVLNLAALILSMAFFLGKCQKIFQQRFNEGVPLASHGRFFKWGVPSVLLVQIFPLLYVELAAFGLEKINNSLTSGLTDASQVPWSKVMMAGPIFLVVGFIVLFWAARCLKAIAFLFKYKVKQVTPPPASAGSV